LTQKMTWYNGLVYRVVNTVSYSKERMYRLYRFERVKTMISGNRVKVNPSTEHT
jgi:hypothetical protein